MLKNMQGGGMSRAMSPGSAMGPATPPLGAPASPDLSGVGIYHMPPSPSPTLMNNPAKQIPGTSLMNNPSNPIPSTINAGNPSLSVPNTSGGLGTIAPRPRPTLGMASRNTMPRAF